MDDEKKNGHVILAVEYGALPPSRADWDDSVQTDTTSQKGHRFHNRRSGWRVGIYIGIFFIALVLVLNVALLAYVESQYPSTDGTHVLYNGDCARTNKLKVGTHLLVNVLATCLLAASNYTMQVLISPTRQDADRAHRAGKWLNIGLPSLRNFRFIGPTRVLLWACLVLSSLPLHLVYNSVIFTSFTAYDYNVLIVSPEFLTGAPIGTPDTNYLDGDDYDANFYEFAPTPDDIARIRQDLSSFTRLEKENCITTYAKPFVTGNSDLVVVTTVRNSTDSLFVATHDGNFFYNSGGAVASWECALAPAPCNPNNPSELPDAATWQPWGYSVDYCLSRVKQNHCGLNFESTLMKAVIAANVAKLALMVIALFVVRDGSLVTIGDAIASFTAQPDETTVGRCLMGKKAISSWAKDRSTNAQPCQYKPARMFWIQSIGVARVWLSLCFIAMGVIVAVVLMRQGIVQLGLGTRSLQTIYKLGFGNVQSQAYWFGGPEDLLTNVLLTNLPQVIFSLMYLVYNGLYTAMLVAYEWSTYARKPRPLRVSRPQGQQRGTYFLQLPYHYAVPLMVASAAAHWVISQSFFVMSVDFTGMDDHDNVSLIAAGYSVFAIVIAFAMGIVMLLVLVLVGLQRLHGTMPFVGSCSAAISAACHGMDEAADPTKKVKWGAVELQGERDYGHCGFSNAQVSDPVRDHWYAGCSM